MAAVAARQSPSPLLVKNPKAAQHGQIRFHDIGDYLSREDKLAKVANYGSVAGIGQAGAWQTVVPDEHGDWLNQREDSFSEFIVLGDKKGYAAKLFDNFSLGVVTNRDSWCYNASKNAVASNMSRMIAFYNHEVQRFAQAHAALHNKSKAELVDVFIDADPRKISWTRSLKSELVKNRQFRFEESSLVQGLYRPYTKQWMYFNRRFNEMVYQMPRIFPETGAENVVIMVNAKHTGDGQIALISNRLPDLHSNGDSQCFPLYLYDEVAQEQDDAQPGLFEADATEPVKLKRRDALTDKGLAHFQSAYPGEQIGKEDVFYYVYGLLHSADYRERYADNLSKELPRIPCVKQAADFWAFSQAGRKLADLHLNYETVTPYLAKVEGETGKLSAVDYRVEKMRYGKIGKDKDLSTIHYDSRITVSGIPLEAYDYVVNGKPAIDWVIERQCIKIDKDSGITNDANHWAVETMGNPRYPLELLLRVITVSLETMKIVRALPKLDI